MFRLICIVVFISQETLADEIAHKVHELFKTTCYVCHGQPGIPAQGNFDYVLDFKKLQTSVYLSANTPEETVLYQDLASGKMPLGGKKYTAEQLALVYSWIKSGAPAPLNF